MGVCGQTELSGVGFVGFSSVLRCILNFGLDLDFFRSHYSSEKGGHGGWELIVKY